MDHSYLKLSTSRISNSPLSLPASHFAANAFGLYDLHGNVREWVEDCYVDTYTGAPTDGSARDTGCGSRIQAVVRGGAWRNNSRSLRSAYRGRNGPSASNRFGGFRLVQELNP